MRAFGKAKEAWQRTILELPNGIPSHDTFWRVFSALGEIIALNGEQLRRSHDKSKGKAAIHMVSAWRRRIVLCSVRSTWTRSQTRSGPSLVQRRVTVDTSASITAPILTVQPRRSYQPCPCPARPSLTLASPDASGGGPCGGSGGEAGGGGEAGQAQGDGGVTARRSSGGFAQGPEGARRDGDERRATATIGSGGRPAPGAVSGGGGAERDDPRTMWPWPVVSCRPGADRRTRSKAGASAQPIRP